MVLDVAGRATRDTPALLTRIAELPPGSSAKVTVLRDAKPLSFDVAVGKRPRAS